MDRNKLLFYDIETFQYDALAVFKNINNEVVAHFWSNPERGRAEYEGRKWVADIKPSGFEGIPNLIQDRILVGYNNYHYDDDMLTTMMNDFTNVPSMLKRQNDRIISGPYYAGVTELSGTQITILIIAKCQEEDLHPVTGFLNEEVYKLLMREGISIQYVPR